MAASPCDFDTYGRLVEARRIWAVASVHGQAERLDRLHARLAQRLAAGDRLVYLGDYLGYGPDSAAALDAVLLFRRAFLAQRDIFLGDIVLLRGSQEEMWQKLMELQFAPNPREVLPWMLEHGVAATLLSYGIDPQQGLAACREGVLAITRWTASLRGVIDSRPGHRQLLTALRRAAFSADGRLLFVNAGIDPKKPLELQGDVFWWGGGDILQLAAPFAGGCRFGGPLVAACFAPDGRVLDHLEA